MIRVDVEEKKFDEIEVYNLEGQLQFVQKTNTFSVAELSEGMYYVVVTNGSVRSVNRFVKK